MKIDRLIGILAILLQQEKVTAPYLAEKFEVSRRTINRDIEAICKAGIPIVTTQGQNGGISIMDGYKVDRTLLTSSDMRAVLAGLRSLDSVCGTKKYQQLMEKLSAGNSNVLMSDSHIAIDLSSWYKSSLAPKIELIQAAIEENRMIGFTYYAPKGESRREMEPYLLVFQWSSWYVWGYCLKRQDFRMFKLNRILDLECMEEVFVPRELPEFKVEKETLYQAGVEVTALFEPDFKWRLIEEYGPDSFEVQEDGRLLFRSWFMDVESSIGWLLTFGNKVELISPPKVRRKIAEIAKEILGKYE
ncbi:WYL domain-containing protein [Clostridium sp. MCC353]|uniref:helix-turn-helix transcriptional regulator n=1 Tax=Clostridium sp. MCC353 TaxID=2592646 RepID=UPI001C028D4A|nr:YafY family protein [Clostridium sp. MCC353]MBT9776072.1 WYL domain-containing protein [Clostridium sp. MCC353]